MSSTTGSGVAGAPGSSNAPPGFVVPTPFLVNAVQVTCVTRRYQVQFALGLFTQDKLIPTKFMASQLAIEITLEQVNNCVFASSATPANWTSFQQQALTYAVGNINLIPEILEFDSSYDEAFLRGLQTGGM